MAARSHSHQLRRWLEVKGLKCRKKCSGEASGSIPQGELPTLGRECLWWLQIPVDIFEHQENKAFWRRAEVGSPDGHYQLYFNVHRLYFKPEHHKWEFSPQKSTSTQQYVQLSLSSTPFQPDIPFTPFKLQSLYSLVSWPICIQIFKALLFFRLILSFSFPVTLLASFFTLHYLVW